MKAKYNSYVKKYGGDANLDWTNFKVRRLYLKLKKKLKSDELAIAGVREYINKKLPG
jgi:phosphotransferase system IIB component